MLSTKFWKKYFLVYDYLNELIPYTNLLSEICRVADIGAGSFVLDVGSGTGNLSQFAEKAGGKVVSVDFSEAGIDIHKSKKTNAEIIHLDITQPLPFPDNNFDVIISNNVLYTIPRVLRSNIALELYRILKPGGSIALCNLKEDFRPHIIYHSHLCIFLKENGVVKTLKKIISLLGPTIKIFYYNFLINLENKNGQYDFFKSGEQLALLKEAGFDDISNEILTYSNQAVLNYARK